jgi:amidase
MTVGTTRTAGSDTSDDEDCLDVAVVNYRMPRLGDAADAVAHAHRIRQMVEGLKLGLAGLDLVVFPPHGPLVGGKALRASEDVLAVLGRACRNAQVWGLFPLLAPQAAVILLNAQGEPVQAWRQNGPCTVAQGPRGWALGLVMGSDDESAAGWHHAEQLGAEVIVRSGSAASPDWDNLAPTQVDGLKARARAHGAYVAMACATDASGVRHQPPRSHSVIVDVNGEVLGECGDEAYGACHAALSRQRRWEARATLDTGPASGITSGTRAPRSCPATATRSPGAAPQAKP